MNGIRIDRQGSCLIWRLDKSRGNAIDAPLTEELIEANRTASADGSVRGVLLASAHPKLFSPGLDLVTLVEYDRPAMERFMLRFAEAVWGLYALAKPMVAAVSGHAVAGGCILALTADYRILRRGAQMGLNEVKVGVPLPWSVALLLRASVPPPSLSKVALLGRNFADDDALRIGLADELAEGDGFEATCLARLEEFVEKDAASLATTKAYLRRDALAAMKAREQQVMADFLDRWFSASTQERIRQTVAALLGKR